MPRLRTLSILLGLAALGLSGAARAQGAPRSMAECERLKNDLAYNQCLAMFGPAAKNVGGGDGGAAASSASASVATALAAIPPGLMATLPQADEPAPQAGRGRRGRRYSRRSGGRQSASFTVGGSESRSHRRHRRRR